MEGAEEIEGLTYYRLGKVVCDWCILEIRSAFSISMFSWRGVN